jgi:hypothetical protein
MITITIYELNVRCISYTNNSKAIRKAVIAFFWTLSIVYILIK